MRVSLLTLAYLQTLRRLRQGVQGFFEGVTAAGWPESPGAVVLGPAQWHCPPQCSGVLEAPATGRGTG